MFSEHVLTTTTNDAQKVHVETGWSERAGGFYLRIKDATAGTARAQKECFLFTSSNLSQRYVTPKVFDFFLEILSGFGIKLPAGMLAELILDGQGGDGEKRVLWSTDGVPKRAC